VMDFESVAGRKHPDDYVYVPFHTPYPGMVRKAAALGYRHMIRDTEIEEALSGEIGYQPRREDFDNLDDFEEEMRTYMDALGGVEAYQNWYAEVIDPTLELAGKVGNWYTGSVHVARASALQSAAQAGRDLAGKRILVASYGSGAQAEVHEETIQPAWREEIESLNVDAQLADRHDLSFEEYEQVHDRHNRAKDIDLEPFTEPDGEFIFDGWGPMNERQYTYVE
jgi:hydroxymethylglutaryl-CoA synthase